MLRYCENNRYGDKAKISNTVMTIVLVLSNLQINPENVSLNWIESEAGHGIYKTVSFCDVLLKWEDTETQFFS